MKRLIREPFNHEPSQKLLRAKYNFLAVEGTIFFFVLSVNNLAVFWSQGSVSSADTEPAAFMTVCLNPRGNAEKPQIFSFPGIKWWGQEGVEHC